MQSWPLCRHPRKHLPSDAGAGQDDGMDFVLCDPGHLTHGSKRVIAHVAFLLSRWGGERATFEGDAYGVDSADAASLRGFDDGSQVCVEGGAHSLRKPRRGPMQQWVALECLPPSRCYSNRFDQANAPTLVAMLRARIAAAMAIAETS